MNKHDVDIRDCNVLAALVIIVILGFCVAIVAVQVISYVLLWW